MSEPITKEERDGPPFTVTRYGSLGAATCRERDWLRDQNERLANALKNLVAFVEGEMGSSAEDDCNVLAAHEAIEEYDGAEVVELNMDVPSS